MFPISVSRLPPGPSQLRPLWAKTGHARIPTNTTIAITHAPTSSETPPSTRSARRSGQGSRSRAKRPPTMRRAPEEGPWPGGPGPAAEAGPVAMYGAGGAGESRPDALTVQLGDRDPLAGDDPA